MTKMKKTMKSKQLISDYINLCVHSIPIYEEHFSNQFYIKKQGVYYNIYLNVDLALYMNHLMRILVSLS